jgi:ferrous iron transport protein B
MALGRTSKCREIQLSKTENAGLSQDELSNKVVQKLETLILDHGKSIEPVISPLGYDWKIGIAIISSARERFRRYIIVRFTVWEVPKMTLSKIKWLQRSTL